jgi:hypothetical protein
LKHSNSQTNITKYELTHELIPNAFKLYPQFTPRLYWYNF